MTLFSFYCADSPLSVVQGKEEDSWPSHIDSLLLGLPSRGLYKNNDEFNQYSPLPSGLPKSLLPVVGFIFKKNQLIY